MNPALFRPSVLQDEDARPECRRQDLMLALQSGA